MQSSTFFLVALAAVLAAACASDSDLYAQESELFQNILKEQPEPPIPEKPMTKQVDPAKKHKLRGGKNPAKLVQAKVAAKVVTTSRRRYSGGSRRRAVVVSSRRRGGFSSGRRRHVVVHHSSGRRRYGYHGRRRHGVVVIHGRRRRHYYSSSGGLCFPNKATVQTKTRGTVPISELSVGDEVMTGKGFAEVMFFAVHKPEADAEHLKITTSTRTLVVSASHGLFDADSHPILAGKVKVGDILHSAGVVDQIEKVKAKGLIAPITTTGTLVVDGVTTSDYGPFAQRVGHGVAHAAMAPIRFLRWAFPGWSVWHPTEANHDSEGKHTIMRLGLKLV
jgi:hypothetical protein